MRARARVRARACACVRVRARIRARGRAVRAFECVRRSGARQAGAPWNAPALRRSFALRTPRAAFTATRAAVRAAASAIVAVQGQSRRQRCAESGGGARFRLRCVARRRLSVEVESGETASVVAEDHTVRVEHRHNLEHEMAAEIARLDAV
eukprot:3283446-Pleurochrysis_carterae.AAC.2